MEVIQIQDPKEIPDFHLPPLSCAIGYFDGVHLGHRKVIETAQRKGIEKGLKSAVITFDPSPKAVLGKNPEGVKYITLLEDKMDLFDEMGLDYLIIIPFTRELAGLLPEQFVDEYLIPLNLKHLTAGFDFTYGKFGKGNMDTIKEHAKGHFSVTKVQKVEKAEEKISSTLIRSLIQEGRTGEVPSYLGRFYSMRGIVVHGEKRGRELGFPTANVEADSRYVFPKKGIYTVRLHWKGKWYPGVASLGHNPTFEMDERKTFLEVHLLNFDGDLYGEKVKVEWHTYLRDEIKFLSAEALKEQIAKDKEEAVRYFASEKG